MSNSPDHPDSNKDDGKSAVATENRWSFIQQELESARHSWDELEKTEPGLSPEEEQWIQIKAIIGQLKDKLEQF